MGCLDSSHLLSLLSLVPMVTGRDIIYKGFTDSSLETMKLHGLVYVLLKVLNPFNLLMQPVLEVHRVNGWVAAKI